MWESIAGWVLILGFWGYNVWLIKKKDYKTASIYLIVVFSILLIYWANSDFHFIPEPDPNKDWDIR